ncbi:hypothetical protein [Nocardia sp. NPDC051570]|uniref:hypothetical protein n=1 Tax=Nocardia sp. NPDC051570 TaxID=3364324 RepID=UPI0037A5FD5F
MSRVRYHHERAGGDAVDEVLGGGSWIRTPSAAARSAIDGIMVGPFIAAPWPTKVGPLP